MRTVVQRLASQALYLQIVKTPANKTPSHPFTAALWAR